MRPSSQAMRMMMMMMKRQVEARHRSSASNNREQEQGPAVRNAACRPFYTVVGRRPKLVVETFFQTKERHLDQSIRELREDISRDDADRRHDNTKSKRLRCLFPLLHALEIRNRKRQ